jgi:hypothetical protein
MPKHILVEDKKFPGMWRVQYPDGTLSDMFNFTRANALLQRLEKK